MAFVSLRQVLDHAAEHGYGVPDFNINKLQQNQAIMEAAQTGAVVQRFLASQVGKGEPVLDEMNAQHSFKTDGRRPLPALE